jgi:antitoxin HigA-1
MVERKFRRSENPWLSLLKVLGRRRISADTALRLGKYFGNSPKFWLGLQDDYDIEEEVNQKKEEFDKIKKINVA